MLPCAEGACALLAVLFSFSLKRAYVTCEGLPSMPEAILPSCKAALVLMRS